MTRPDLAARSFLHGSPTLNRALGPVARPLLRHLPRLQEDPALAALQRFAEASGDVNFVQLGAHDGLANDPLHDLVMSRTGWRGVVVEPVPEHYAALTETYAAVSERVRCERAVVGSLSGRASFYRIRESPDIPEALRQVGSLSRAHVEAFAASVPNAQLIVDEEDVASTTFPDLLLRHSVGVLDLVHMDIEGAEPVVLTQIDFAAAWAPRAILFEHTHFAAAELSYWKTRLRSAGYALQHGRLDTWAERTPKERTPAPQPRTTPSSLTRQAKRVGAAAYRRINRDSTLGLAWKKQGEHITFEWDGFVAAPSVSSLFARHHYETAVIDRLLNGKDIQHCLEYGCGFGRLSPTFARLARRHTAIDINASAVNAAKAAYPHLDYRTYDGQRIPFADGAFDLVVTWTVIQHVSPERIEATLADILRALRPGGRLLLCEETRNAGEGSRHAWHREVAFYAQQVAPLRLTYSAYIDEIDRIPGLTSPGRVMFFEP